LGRFPPGENETMTDEEQREQESRQSVEDKFHARRGEEKAEREESAEHLQQEMEEAERRDERS
jgi:hypothetical protein